MKNKNIVLTAIFLLAIFSVIGIASAATTLIAPVTLGNYTTTLNVTLTTAVADSENVTCWYNASGGSVNSTNILMIVSNTTADQTTFSNVTVPLSGLTDSLNYSIVCQVDGIATSENSTIVQSITFDSTNPVCNITADHVIIPYKGNILLTWYSSDALSLISTSVKIDGPQDQTTTTHTDTDNFLTLTSQETKYFGDWTANITGTDRAGNTCTDTLSFKSYLPDGEWEEEPITPSKDTGKLVLLVIAGIAVLYFAFGKKK